MSCRKGILMLYLIGSSMACVGKMEVGRQDALGAQAPTCRPAAREGNTGASHLQNRTGGRPCTPQAIDVREVKLQIASTTSDLSIAASNKHRFDNNLAAMSGSNGARWLWHAFCN